MLERFTAILKQVLNGKNTHIPITPDTNIFSDLGMQSLSIIGLMVLCEAEFGVDLASKISSIDDVSKVSDLIEFIKKSGGQ